MSVAAFQHVTGCKSLTRLILKPFSRDDTTLTLGLVVLEPRMWAVKASFDWAWFLLIACCKRMFTVLCLFRILWAVPLANQCQERKHSSNRPRTLPCLGHKITNKWWIRYEILECRVKLNFQCRAKRWVRPTNQWRVWRSEVHSQAKTRLWSQGHPYWRRVRIASVRAPHLSRNLQLKLD